MSTETKQTHTPGPLQVREVYGCIYVAGAEGNSLANLGGNDGRTMADATLFAAAPDLLAACKLALDFIADVSNAGDDRAARLAMLEWEKGSRTHALREAIARAEQGDK